MQPPQGGLAQIFLENRARLLRFLVARGAGDAAEDVLQELWERIGTTPAAPIAAPLSYLFRAAENVMRDRHRSESSRTRREQDYAEVHAEPGGMPGSEQALLAREQLQRVEQALTALGPRTEGIFRRYRLDGIGQAAIAREFAVSLSTVEKELQKAYKVVGSIREGGNAE